MTFCKKEDGYWHWECERGYVKGTGRYFKDTFYLFFLAMAVIFSGIAFVKSLPLGFMFVLLMIIMGIVGLTLFFVWLPERLEKPKRRCFTADEEGFYCGEVMDRKRGGYYSFESVQFLRQIKESQVIEVKVPLKSRFSRPYTYIYTTEEDFDEVFCFFKAHCREAGIRETVTENGKTFVRHTPQSKRKRYSILRMNFWIFGCIGLFFSLIISMAKLGSAPEDPGFIGIGSAKIERVNDEDLYPRVSYEMLCDIAGETFLHTEIREETAGWQTGDQIPVTYNIHDPSVFFVGNNTGEFQRTLSWICRGMWLISFGLILSALYLGSRIRKEKKENTEKSETGER